MNAEPDKVSPTKKEMSRLEYTWRVAWIGIRLILVYSLAEEFQPFFYQAF